MSRLASGRCLPRRAHLDVRWLARGVLAGVICLANCGDAEEPGRTGGSRATGGASSGGGGSAGSTAGAGPSGSGGSTSGGSGGSTSGGSGGSPTGGSGGAVTGGAAGSTTGGAAGSTTAGSGGASGRGGGGAAGAAGNAGNGGAAGRADAGQGDASGPLDVAIDLGRADANDGRPTDTSSSDTRDAGVVDVSTDAAANCGLANVVTKAYFDSIFPPANRHAVYTYEGFIAAAAGYPAFVNTGTLDACRKEAAAFLANVKRETGSLRYAEQIAKEAYCSSQTGCACDANTTDQSKWYYGRGAIQLSWNYNYCSAGTALGVDLLSNPGQVATNPELAWKTALWFWMTSDGAGTATCHETMTTSGAFGETIRTINGGQECNMGGYGSVSGVTERVDAYIQFAKGLGIANPGLATDLDC